MPHPYTDGMAESWISSHEDEYQRGNSMILAITLKETLILIGSIGLYINKRHQNAELGYWIGRDFWNKGYCTEAVSEVVNFGFHNLSLNKIFAQYISRNNGSGKVLQKNGFVHEGMMRKHVKYMETFEDLECMGLLRSEFLQNIK